MRMVVAALLKKRIFVCEVRCPIYEPIKKKAKKKKQ